MTQCFDLYCRREILLPKLPSGNPFVFLQMPVRDAQRLQSTMPPSYRLKFEKLRQSNKELVFKRWAERLSRLFKHHHFGSRFSIFSADFSVKKSCFPCSLGGILPFSSSNWAVRTDNVSACAWSPMCLASSVAAINKWCLSILMEPVSDTCALKTSAVGMIFALQCSFLGTVTAGDYPMRVVWI